MPLEFAETVFVNYLCPVNGFKKYQYFFSHCKNGKKKQKKKKKKKKKQQQSTKKKKKKKKNDRVCSFDVDSKQVPLIQNFLNIHNIVIGQWYIIKEEKQKLITDGNNNFPKILYTTEIS